MGLIFNNEGTYKFAKDGYLFNYYDEDDNKRMLKLYNENILPIIKDFKLKRCFKGDLVEFNTIEFEGNTTNSPSYVYIPKSKDELSNFILRIREATYFGSQDMEEMKIGEKYIVHFYDDDGEFGFGYYTLNSVKEDIQKLTDMVKDL